MPNRIDQVRTTEQLIREGCAPRIVQAPPAEEPLAAAMRALEEIANPTFGIGFRGLKQIAKRGLREIRAAQAAAQGRAA